MTTQTVKTKRGRTLDGYGAFASTICALHCAACALLPATLTAIGLGFLIGHETEWLLTVFAVFFASAAFVLSWRSHKNLFIMASLSIGIVGLLSARVLEGGAHHDNHGLDTHKTKHQDNEPRTKTAQQSHKSDKEHHTSVKTAVSYTHLTLPTIYSV